MPKPNTDAAAKVEPPKRVERPKPVGDAEKLGLLLGWKCINCGTLLEGPGNAVIRPCPKCGRGEFMRVGALRKLLRADTPIEPAPVAAKATEADTVVSTDGLPFVGPTTAPIAVDDEDLDDEDSDDE